MKKVIAILVFLVVLIGLRCSTNPYVITKNDATPKPAAPSVPASKRNSLTNAKTFYPGKLIWDGSYYQADFGNGGTLTISGPYPYTSPPTPAFNVLSANIPNSTVTSDGFSTFTETWIVLPTTPQFVNVPIEDIGGVPEDASITIPTSYSDPFSLTLFGKIVQIDGVYYALGTDYQTQGQAKTPITPPSGRNSVTIRNLLNSQYYNSTVFFSIDNGANWTAIQGTTYNFPDPDDFYIFQVSITNAPGYQSPATFNLITPAQSVSSQADYTIPPGGLTLTTSTAQISNSNFTVRINAAPYVAVQLSNLVGSGATLLYPQYSLDGGQTWLTFTSTINIPMSTYVIYKGTFTCPAGQEQVDEIITPGGTTMLTHQTVQATVTATAYNGGTNGYTVTFQNPTY